MFIFRAVTEPDNRNPEQRRRRTFWPHLRSVDANDQQFDGLNLQKLVVQGFSGGSWGVIETASFARKRLRATFS